MKTGGASGNMGLAGGMERGEEEVGVGVGGGGVVNERYEVEVGENRWEQLRGVVLVSLTIIRNPSMGE